MSRLVQIQNRIQERVDAILREHGEAWPCRKGCSDCCRNLASEPRVSREEWLRLDAALQALPSQVGQAARKRIGTDARVCPFLDDATGACLVYEARPLACRAYGFYAERGKVLGCGRIEEIALERESIVWGNHAVLLEHDREGEAVELSRWLVLE